mgnify:CR=1 FL=1
MEFDPTYDYGMSDLTVDENALRWQFSSLLTTLITLASNAQRQIAIIGIGAVCEEMAEDFYSYFTLPCQSYLNHNLLTSPQAEKLRELDAFFDARSGEHLDMDFWDHSFLATNPDWDSVRQKASSILELLGMQNLRVEFDREEKYNSTAEGQRLVMQATRTRLVFAN